MCFHYALTKERAEIEIQLQAQWDDDWQPVFHVDGFRFPAMPVITEEAPDRLQYLQWGLIPHWIKSRSEADVFRAQTLNARSESMFDKPSFRPSVMHHRCLVPADGFYEWMDFQKKKYPHFIYQAAQALFCFAGLYANWTDRETGEMRSTYTILTTEANETVGRIHNQRHRMPVILDPVDYRRWLDPSLEPDAIRAMLKPYAGELRFHTISKRITSRTENSDAPETLEPVLYPELALAY